MPKKSKSTGTISDTLRAIIQESGLTAYSLGKMTGVNAAVIARFLNGERDLRLGTVDKLCDALSCELSRKPKGKNEGDS